MVNIPKGDILIIMGDFNAKVGQQSMPPLVGKHGLGTMNEAGERLVDFCAAQELVIANTWFAQPKRRLYTWTAPGGKHRNQIDYFLISKRWRSSIKAVNTLPGADCGSDHELLAAKLQLKLKRVKKVNLPQRYDLQNIPMEYNIQVKNKFNAINFVDKEPDELWQEIKTIITDAAV